MYALLAWTWTRAAAQYPASMVMLTASQAVVSCLDLVAILLMFSHTPRLGGFSLAEVMFLYGTASVAFGISDVLLSAATQLGDHVRNGTLDPILVRPVSPLLQVAVENFSPRRFGKLLPAGVVLAISLSRLPVEWTPVKVLMLPLMVAGATGIFGALWVLSAAWQFAVVDGRQATNSMTYGGAYLTQYPLSIFGRDALRALTWTLPLAFVNWEPALYVLGRPDPLGLPVAFRFASPAVAAVLWAIALLAWRAGLRRYRSTGS